MRSTWSPLVVVSVCAGMLLLAAGSAKADPWRRRRRRKRHGDAAAGGCEYLSPTQVHEIIDGLPPGTTIELAPIHKDFICNKQGTVGVCSFSDLVDCKEPGGDLGGEKECSDSHLSLDLKGTGMLAGWQRAVNLPVSFETHVGPRNPGDPVQQFPAEMFRLFGQLPPGDPDFDLLRVTAGNDFGCPAPATRR